MIKSVTKFINYWYFRYLLVTELYMVEKWERVMIHIVFLLMLSILSVFNWKVVLGFTAMLYESSSLGLTTALLDFSVISGFIIMYLAITNKKS